MAGLSWLLSDMYGGDRPAVLYRREACYSHAARRESTVAMRRRDSMAVPWRLGYVHDSRPTQQAEAGTDILSYIIL